MDASNERFVGFCEKLFVSIEREIDVNAWRFGDVALWPFLRVMIYSRIFRSCLGGADNILHNSTPIGSRWPDVFSTVARRRREVGPDISPTLDPIVFRPRESGMRGTGAGPALFLTHPMLHVASTTDGFVETTVDPWVDLAREERSVVKVEFADPTSAAVQPRRHSTLQLCRPRLEDVRRRGSGDAVEGFVRALDGARRALERHCRDEYGFDLGAYLEPSWRSFAEETALSKLGFSDLLDSLRPIAVFQQNYYGPSGLALNWAAAERGVPSVDIQHGAVGRYHAAYSHWTRIPREGYAGLPTVFLVWGELSALHIAEHLRPGISPHRVLIGGRPGLHAEAVDPPVRSTNDVRVVLVSLSVVSTPGFGLGWLTEAMRRSPPGWRWLVRCHPFVPPDHRLSRVRIKAELIEAGVTNAEVDRAPPAPLIDALRACDHHVTHLSSTWQECLWAGIPTTFIHPLASYNGEELFRNGTVGFAGSADELLAEIAARPRSTMDGRRVIETDPDLARAALRDIWEGGAVSTGVRP